VRQDSTATRRAYPHHGKKPFPDCFHAVEKDAYLVLFTGSSWIGGSLKFSFLPDASLRSSFPLAIKLNGNTPFLHKFHILPRTDPRNDAEPRSTNFPKTTTESKAQLLSSGSQSTNLSRRCAIDLQLPHQSVTAQKLCKMIAHLCHLPTRNKAQ
jgi:hypothetical protein